MIANVNRIRTAANPRHRDYTKNALDFMDRNGHPGYSEEINQLQSQFDEIQAEAGPGGLDCPQTQAVLDSINDEIWEIAEAAAERIEDWKTDPLP